MEGTAVTAKKQASLSLERKKLRSPPNISTIEPQRTRLIMHDTSSAPAYGLWSLVIINSLVFIIFAFSFAKPQSPRDWRSFGAFSAFLVALFTEMYGYPLTIYLFSGWLTSRFPGVDLSHNSGHLWNDLIGWKGDAHFSPFHLASYAFIGGGFWIIADGWKHLYQAQKTRALATTGPYER